MFDLSLFRQLQVDAHPLFGKRSSPGWQALAALQVKLIVGCICLASSLI
jgi:hypothetical protein